jgi:hypothetical protein
MQLLHFKTYPQEMEILLDFLRLVCRQLAHLAGVKQVLA